MNCKQCGRLLGNDEIALHKRMIHRGATEHLCLSCMARYFGCSEDILMDKIAYFKRIGCLLFTDGQQPPA